MNMHSADPQASGNSADKPSGLTVGTAESSTVSVPDHVLIRRIGRGAYGEVWLAKNALGLYRAVKIVRRAFFDDDRPFEREFAGIQRFEPVSRRHESQLNILHVGRGSDYFYYVMELADDMGRGQEIDESTYTPRTLRSELLLHGRLAVSECIRLGMALTTALEHLHRHGLVHRDIKPSNIVFVNGIPKLADIGLVAVAKRTMSFVGTEGYLPPEGPGTAQADLFSLGKVLYEISTGHDRQQFPDLPTNVIELPDRAALTELNEVLVRACAPEARQRYQSAAEMHADLALLQSGKSVARLREVERHLKFVIRAGAAVTLIAGLLTAGWFWQAHETHMVRQLASEKTELAVQNSKIAEDHRERLVRADIANGVRRMEGKDQDYSAALLWFTEALPLVTNRPVEEAIHRIRIQQLLDHQPRLLRILPHESSVYCGSFSPNGRLVATGTRGKLRVWQADSGRIIWENAQPGRILFTRFSRTGRHLFVSSSPEQKDQPNETQFAAVLDADTGKPAFPVLTNDLICSAFSGDDRWVAIARGNNTIQLLNAETGQPVSSFGGHMDQIQMLSFSPDGNLLGSASRDKTVRIWRVPSGDPLPVLEHQAPVRRVTFSPDSRWVATATGAPGYNSVGIAQAAQAWSAVSGAKVGLPHLEPLYVRVLFFGPNSVLFTSGEADEMHLWAPTANGASPHSLAFPVTDCWDVSQDGRLVALGTDLGYASIWNTQTWETLYIPFRHTGWVVSVRFSQDARQLLTTSDDGTAKIWDLTEPYEQGFRLLLEAALPDLRPGSKAIYSQRMAVLDKNRLLIALTNATVHSIDLRTFKDEPVVYPAAGGEPVGAIALDLTGNQWATAPGIIRYRQGPCIVGLWRRQNDGVHHLELSHPVGVRELSFDSKGDALVTFADERAWIWKTTDGTLLRLVTLPDHAHFCTDFCSRLDAFLPMAQHNSGNLQCYDLLASRWVGPELPPEAVNAFSISPDRSRLAVAGGNQRGQVWDLGSGKPATPLFKHGGNLTSVEWSASGRRLVTAGLGGVKEWNSATGERAAAPMGDFSPNPPRTAHFSPDGRFIFSFSAGILPERAHQAQVWDATTGEPVTPVLDFLQDVRAAMMTSQARLILITDPGLIRAFDLNETRLTLGCLNDYAQLLSARKIDPYGELVALMPAELDQLQESLRKRAPELFVPRGN